jgi:hypothetical protein
MVLCDFVDNVVVEKEMLPAATNTGLEPAAATA